MGKIHRIVQYLSLAAASILLAGTNLHAATIYFGVEDAPGTNSGEGLGDYNDIIGRITGNFTINAPGVVYTNLVPGGVNETGNPFFANPSTDGAQKNIGYCLTNTGGCVGAITGAPFSNLQYLSTASGGALNVVTLSAIGTETVTLLLETSAYSGQHTLGWYDINNNVNTPGTLQQIFPGSATPGSTATFTFTGTIALYSQNLAGNFYSSIAASNLNESTTQQHFAFFSDTGTPTPVPEPATTGLVTLAIAWGIYGQIRSKRKLAGKQQV